MSKAKDELATTMARVRIDKGRYCGFDARVTLPRVIAMRGVNADTLATRLKRLLECLDDFAVVREE